MAHNEEETRFHLIDPVLRAKGYGDPRRILLETRTPAPVEAIGFKGRRSARGGRTDYLLCVQVGDMPRPLPVAVLEAKKESEDPLKGMEQAKAYADCNRFDVQYVFATNGHLYGDFDKPSGLQTGPHPLAHFPTHEQLCARYAKDKRINLDAPEATLLFQGDSPAWNKPRYYQDAAIRAALEKILHQQQAGEPPRILLTLATGAGKTIIATNLLWRMSQAGLLRKPALFLCDRDELRQQARSKLRAAFGESARIVETVRGGNAAANARIHIATYQTLGIDESGDASFLTQHYGEDAFSVIIIDECHRSAWGKWSQVLTRNPHAIHIGLTATPRKLKEPARGKKTKAAEEDDAITAHNLKYFGEPVYQYTLAQAQEDGWLAACQIVKRKADIDKKTFTREEIIKAGVRDIKTGRPLTEDDLAKAEYTGKDFDDELFIDLRTPKMCADLFAQLCENGGPEQKAIIFCTRDLHADRVAQEMNNLYARWCSAHGRERKSDYAFKCTAAGGAEKIETMRGSSQRAFIACTVDLLEAGVDIERLNAVIFFRYVQSPIKFYQMLGRGTRIHEATEKYKFWLYDYTGVTDLFGADFITTPPRPRPPKGGGDGPGEPPGGGGDEPPPPIPGINPGTPISITPQGTFIVVNRGGIATPVPLEDYRRDIITRILAEAHSIDDFRALWVQQKKRRQLINHLLGAQLDPDHIREAEHMQGFDLYDIFTHHAWHAHALTRTQRADEYLQRHAPWFDSIGAAPAIILRGIGQQFAKGGTDALESKALWSVPEIERAGGLAALSALGAPADIIHDAKMRLFGV